MIQVGVLYLIYRAIRRKEDSQAMQREEKNLARQAEVENTEQSFSAAE